MTRSSSVCFGCIPGCLDIFSLSYRWFGVVWRWEGELQFVLGYWFADNRNELVKQVKDKGWTDYVQVRNKAQIQSIYHEIRTEQKRQDWEKRSQLPLLSTLRKPWREMKPGWYIHRSRSEFPLVATCIERKKFAVWIEHVSVCEHSADVDDFIRMINLKHGIQLNQLS
jgi:hypothetical protein